MKYFQSSSYNSGYDYNYNKSTSGLSDLIKIVSVIVVVGIVIYAFYKTCIDSHSLEDTQYSSTDEDYRGQNPGAGGWAELLPGRCRGGRGVVLCEGDDDCFQRGL